VLRGSGTIQGMSVALAWDPRVVRPLGQAIGSLVADAGGVLFSPRPGAVDVAVLGAGAPGLAGEGEIGSIAFEVIAAGDPGIRVLDVQARDGANQDVAVALKVPTVSAVTTFVTGLAQPAPNPFSARTAITFRLAQAGPVDLAVFSVDGRRVRTLAQGDHEAGAHVVPWDGTNEGGRRLPAGVYYVRLSAARGTYRVSTVLLR
jgi:hypothetical protein